MPGAWIESEDEISDWDLYGEPEREHRNRIGRRVLRRQRGEEKSARHSAAPVDVSSVC